jgi:hypothetical protein
MLYSDCKREVAYRVAADLSPMIEVMTNPVDIINPFIK